MYLIKIKKTTMVAHRSHKLDVRLASNQLQMTN